MGLNKRLINTGEAAPGQLLDIVQYTGDGSSSRTITTANSPSLVQIKKDGTSDWIWAVPDGGYTSSNLTTAETTNSAVIQSLGSNKFVVGNNDNVNTNGVNYTAYSWESNPANGFEVVDFTTGGSNSGLRVNHNLGTTPYFFMIKNLDTDEQHLAYHVSIQYPPWMRYVQMPSTANQVYVINPGIWSSAPNSTTIGMRVGYGEIQTNTNYRAFIFANAPDVMTIGGFTGSHSTKTINLGWQPRWVMLRDVNNYGGWYIHDFSTSPPYRYLWHSSGGKAGLPSYLMALTASGFSCVNVSTYNNFYNHKHIYVAIK